MRWLALVLLVGCGDPLVERQLVVDTRIVAARVEAKADPSRSNVSSGEEATARLYVVGPEGPPAIHWRLDACVAEPTTSGLVRCREALASVHGQEEPAIDWIMPAADERVAVVGLVCDGPFVDTLAAWPDWRCASGEDNLVSFTADGEANLHPDVGRDVFELDGVAWEDACVSLLPGAQTRIAWRVSDDNREAGESLRLSHFVTAGELERAFSSIAPGEPGVAEMTWTAPASETLVTFHFVVRDGRGGTDWTSRTVCVEKGQSE